MNTTQPIQAKELYIPDSYTGMDDILIPTPPFELNTQWEAYRFEPLVLIDIPNDKLELDVYVYVTPDIKLKGKDLKDIIVQWINNQQSKYGVEFAIIKNKSVKVNNYSGTYLEYTAPGYDDNRSSSKRFIERIYFLQVASQQIASFRLIRHIDDDLKTQLLDQWQAFINSIKFQQPDPHRQNTVPVSSGQKRYFSHNLYFEIPRGLPNGLNKWRNKQNAERLDTWKTPDGDIKVKYKISAGYDFSVESGNSNIKTEKQGMASNATAILKNMNPDYDTEHEYLEAGFAKDRKIFGYIEKNATHTGLVMEVAYKHGRTISIKVDGQTTAMEKNHDLILKWLPQFVILPDNK